MKAAIVMRAVYLNIVFYISLNRGGLAERLKELQNRERSAISLWRHRCVSYQMTPLGKIFYKHLR